MRNPRRPSHSLPNARTLTVIAQDPAVKVGGSILTTELTIPAEELLPGPCGYRVNVIDYDSSTDTLYRPAVFEQLPGGHIEDPFAPGARTKRSGRRPRGYDRRLLTDPRFHAQNVYAIVMRTLAQFEFALGRRVAWGSDGHQIHVAPHAFADANAFYSRDDRAIFFGYFTGAGGKPVYTCLSHDVVAHESAHAILDGLRRRGSTSLPCLFYNGVIMALNLKNAEVERLAAEVSRLTGESKTEAIRRALEERRQRLKGPPTARRRARVLAFLRAEVWPTLPPEQRGRRLSRAEDVNPAVIRYVNRLSDLFFVLSRWIAKQTGEQEYLWQRGLQKKPKAK